MGKAVDAKEIINIINEIESKVNVQDWNVKGVDVWPLIRIKIGSRINNSGSSVSSKKKNSLLQVLLGILRVTFKKVFNSSGFSRKKKKVDFLFLTNSSSLQNKVNGEWYDSFINPVTDILDKKGYSYMIYEFNNQNEVKNPSYTEYVSISNKLTFINIKSILKRFWSGILDDHSKKIIEQINFILEKRGFPNCLLTNGFVKKRIIQILEHYKYFAKLIRRHNPKAVWGANYYGMEMAMSLACHHKGIPTVDIQHGVQGDYHLAYGSWKNVPENGYNLLPDFFAVWGEKEKSTIEKWNNNNHIVKVIGNPIANSSITEKTDNSTIESIYKKSKINVLITLQELSGIEELYLELLSSNSSDFFYWVRAHPRMTKGEREKVSLLLKNIEGCNFNIASNSLLYQLFPYIDVHITKYSTVTIEALEFDIPTILVHPSGKVHYSNEMEQNLVFYESKIENILKKIKALGRKNTSYAGSNGKSDFVHNVLSLIDEIEKVNAQSDKTAF